MDHTEFIHIPAWWLSGDIALCMVALTGLVAAAEALLSAGADVTAKFRDKTATEWAAKHPQDSNRRATGAP